MYPEAEHWAKRLLSVVVLLNLVADSNKSLLLVLPSPGPKSTRAYYVCTFSFFFLSFSYFY